MSAIHPTHRKGKSFGIDKQDLYWVCQFSELKLWQDIAGLLAADKL